MKYAILIFTLLACAESLVYGQYNSDNLRISNAIESGKFSYKNLQLYPVYANATFRNHHRLVGNYMTLEEALKNGNKIRITEVASGTVNKLYIENISTDTVMLLSGEVVKGGKQDRMIASDVLLSPKSGKKEISVFCVEQNRWTDARVQNSFTNYFSISSNDVRKAAVVEKNQSTVWSKVEKTVSSNNASTSTGTLAALKDSKSLQDELEGYVAYFSAISRDESVIGVVAVSGNRILGCDMFATHEIFKKSYPNLLNSYSTEAITTGFSVTVAYSEVSNYVNELLKDEKRQESEIQKKGTLLKDKDRKVHISTF